MCLSGQQREGERPGTALGAIQESGTILPKVLGDVFKVLVPRREWYRHPAGQAGVAL